VFGCKTLNAGQRFTVCQANLLKFQSLYPAGGPSNRLEKTCKPLKNSRFAI
jgi:hypothetical protein